MGNPHFILFPFTRRLVASRVIGLPMAFFHNGENYKRLHSPLGEFNHLLDTDGTLWGFHLSSPSLFSPQLAQNRAWISCENVIGDESELFTILGDQELSELTNDCAQLLGVVGFVSPTNQFIVAIPEVSQFPEFRQILWQRIGFAFCSATAPQPV